MIDKINSMLKAFGPCTELYECWDMTDILAETEKGSLKDFAKEMLDVEKVQSDRYLWSMQDDPRHSKLVDSETLRLKALEERINKWLRFA